MIWWHLVPFANLVAPFRAFQNVYEASFPKGVYAVLPSYAEFWWGSWVAFLILERMLRRVSEADAQTQILVLSLMSAAGVAASVLGRRIVSSLARRQQETADLVGV